MSGFTHGPWFLSAAYLLTVNFTAFMMFGWDKRCARLSRQRIPEKRLLTVAAIGGTLGAKAGQRWFRHKTYKQPFRNLLNLVLTLQIGLLCLAIWMVLQAPPPGALTASSAGLQ